MNHRTLLLSAVLATSAANAQHPLIADYDWGERPEVPDTVQVMTDPEVILHRTCIVDRVEEDENVVEYYLVHMRTFLRDAAAIERNNQVTVGTASVLDVHRMQARSMTPDGRVVELGPEAFKEATDDEGETDSRYFAFEGLVPGSVIEYIVVLKNVANLRGDHELLQYNVPLLHVDLHLVSPARFEMAAKSYNGAPEMQADTSDAELQHLYLTMENVPALENEPSASPTVHKARVDFRLDRVDGRSARDYSSFVNATKLFHSAVHRELDKKTDKELGALIKRMRLGFARDQADKVRTMEQYLKTNFAIIEVGAPQLSDPAFILENKAANQMGMVVLHCAVLRKEGIPYELVIGCDRSRRRLDPEFESFLPLQDVFIHLPELNAFLAPAETDLRLGFIPAGNTATDALFIRNFDLGGSFTGVGSVKHVPAPPDTATVHDLFMQVKLEEDASVADISFENHLSGYYATFQPYIPFLDDEQRGKLTADLVGFLTEGSESHDLEIENGEGKYMGVEPLIIKGDVRTGAFSGTAGDKVLFKFGELIGPQVEMYNEKPRQLPVDDEYNRRFLREITLTLPDGWTVQNPEELDMDHHLERDGERVLQFTSTHTLEGNVLTVRMDEFYRVVELPVEDFEAYRTVVNAAADMNKVTLVLARN